MPNKEKTLWVFIDDSISKDNKYFITMYIVTEYSNFDREVQIMKSRIKKLKTNLATNLFLETPKYSRYKKLTPYAKRIVINTLEICTDRIIEHNYLSKKIVDYDFVNYYYKDHIKEISDGVIHKYKNKYSKIIFDHTSNVNINKLILYENQDKNIMSGNDKEETGLVIVDLLRCKINI